MDILKGEYVRKILRSRNVFLRWKRHPFVGAGSTAQPLAALPPYGWGVPLAGKPARTPLPEAIRQFKTFSARKINQMRGTPGKPVWQRGYYDHIIRDEAGYLRDWQYIDTNPAKWEEDEYYIP